MSKKSIMKLSNLISSIKPEKVFVILAFVFGILFTFITPPFQVADEANHFYRIYELSEFKIIAKKTDNISGDYIPKYLILMVKDLEGNIHYHFDRKFSVSKLGKYWDVKTNFNDKQFVDFRNTTVYSPVLYLPQLAGIVIAKTINFSPLLMIYLGRLFNLFTFIIMAYFAIKLTPLCKWGFALLSLMPMTLYQAASLSSDPLCFGLTFLFIAFVLNCALSENKISNIQLVKIAIMSVILGLCKSAYFFIIFLFLLIPIKKIGSGRKYFIWFFIIILLTTIFSISWASVVNRVYLPLTSFVNPREQLIYMQSHPLAFFQAMFSFFDLRDFYYIDTIDSFVGNLGWLDNPLPRLLVLIFIDFLIFIALFDNNNNKYLDLRQKIIVAINIILNITLICFSLYLINCEVGDTFIEVIQGRYLIPIAPLFLLLFYNKFTNKMNVIKRGGNLIIVCFSIITLLIALFLIIKRFYIC